MRIDDKTWRQSTPYHLWYIFMQFMQPVIDILYRYAMTKFYVILARIFFTFQKYCFVYLIFSLSMYVVQ